MNCERNLKFRKFLANLESQNSPAMDEKVRINDCYEILESVAWLWRFVGAFPFTIRHSMGTKVYGLNKFYALYGIFISVSCTVTYILGWLHLRKWMSYPISIEHITMIIRTTAAWMCLIVFGIWRLIRYKELTESIETMAAQDLLLEKLGCRFDYESNARIIRTYVWTSFVIVITFVGYDYFTSYQVMERISIEWLFLVLPHIAQVVDITILVSLVGLLGFRFRALNDKITAIAIRANSASPNVIVTSDVCANNLVLVAKVHYNICAVGKRINAIFSWDVIINVVTAFIILSTTLYYIFVEVQRDDGMSYIRIGTYVHWEFIHSVPIIVIVIVCNWTTNEGINTGKLIHEIRVVKADTRLYESVKSFALQLHHQKLEFNAGGFFPINSTLLQTMVGNITTYLVILIQFEPKLN